MSMPDTACRVNAGRLIERAGRSLRAERAARLIALTAAPAGILVVLAEVAARVWSMPDLRWAAASVLLLPFLLGALSFRKNLKERAAERRAGEATPTPAIFLADEGGHGPLEEMLGARAEEAAAKAAPVKPFIGLGARVVPVVYLLAVLALVAPGRKEASRDRNEAARLATIAAARSAEAALADSPPEAPLPPEAREALATAGDPDSDPAATAAAVEALKTALAAVQRDERAFAEAAASASLLRDLGRAVAARDPEAVRRALRTLAERLAAGDEGRSSAQAAAEALLLAIPDTGDSGLRSLLERAGRALAAGDASGAGEALEALAESHLARAEARRPLERVVVAFEARTGGRGTLPRKAAVDPTPLAPGPGGASSGRTPIEGAPTRDPFEEGVLRRYFAADPSRGGRR